MNRIKYVEWNRAMIELMEWTRVNNSMEWNQMGMEQNDRINNLIEQNRTRWNEQNASITRKMIKWNGEYGVESQIRIKWNGIEWNKWNKIDR